MQATISIIINVNLFFYFRGIGLFIGVEIIKEVDNVEVADGAMAKLIVKK